MAFFSRKNITRRLELNYIAHIIRYLYTFVKSRQFTIQLYMNNHTLLKKLYEFHELDAKLLLLHQISEFVSDCEVDVQNWQFFSQLFQG